MFVVDVTSFTKGGFVGTSTFEGEKVEVEFDEEGDGVFLSSEMARRIGARKDISVSVVVEDQTHTSTRTRIAGLGNRIRTSDAKVTYAVGKEGGAIVRVRRP